MPAIPALRRWHRRLSLLVGLQLLAWTVSGLVFTWDPIEVVRGESSLREEPPPPALEAEALRPAGEVAAGLGLTALQDARLAWHRGRWTWSLRGPGADRPVLADARDGRALPELAASEAAALAAARLVTPAAVADVARVERAEGEYRGKPVPAWRVRFDDPQQHHLYLDPDTGEVLAVRHDTWRRFDLL